MKAFNLRLDTLILRFYLVMLIVIISGFTRTWVLAFLALPIILSCMWGIDFGFRKMKGSSQKAANWISHLRTPLHHTA